MAKAVASSTAAISLRKPRLGYVRVEDCSQAWQNALRWLAVLGTGQRQPTKPRMNTTDPPPRPP
ncbi:hypothetical protein ACFV2I_35800, partial [Streptomyces microflavus]|uniref:hypothetical protein n=1 Tax=Streptomyces microflavus TaxID=1919 RepID=UPI00368DE9EB